MYGKVVLPTDGSKFSFVGLDEGLRAAKILEIPAVAVYVVSHSKYSHGFMDYMDISSKEMIRDMGIKEGEDVLERVEKRAKKLGIELETRLMEGTPFEEIVKIADKDDIIYMSSHGHSGISSFFMGSTTDRVLKHTKATVAVVKAVKQVEQPKDLHTSGRVMYPCMEK